MFGLITDLKMTSVQYSWCSSIFYVGALATIKLHDTQIANHPSGQLVAEFPFIYLMSRLHLAKFVGITM